MSVLLTPPERLSRMHAVAQSLHFDRTGKSRDPWASEDLTKAFKALHAAQVAAWNDGLEEGDADREAVTEVDFDRRWPEDEDFWHTPDKALLHGFIGELGMAVYNTVGRSGLRQLEADMELVLYQHGERPALHVLAGIPRI